MENRQILFPRQIKLLHWTIISVQFVKYVERGGGGGGGGGRTTSHMTSIISNAKCACE